MTDVGLWGVKSSLCECSGTTKANKVNHVAFPDQIFCCHERDLVKEEVLRLPNQVSVHLADSKFDYFFFVDRDVWQNKLQKKKESLYFYVICKKVKKTKIKQQLFVDYLIHNVCNIVSDVVLFIDFLIHYVCNIVSDVVLFVRNLETVLILHQIISKEKKDLKI